MSLQKFYHTMPYWQRPWECFKLAAPPDQLCCWAMLSVHLELSWIHVSKNWNMFICSEGMVCVWSGHTQVLDKTSIHFAQNSQLYESW